MESDATMVKQAHSSQIPQSLGVCQTCASQPPGGKVAYKVKKRLRCAHVGLGLRMLSPCLGSPAAWRQRRQELHSPTHNLAPARKANLPRRQSDRLAICSQVPRTLTVLWEYRLWPMDDWCQGKVAGAASRALPRIPTRHPPPVAFRQSSHEPASSPHICLWHLHG